MVRVIPHDEAAELLGVYALDAVEPAEAEALEAHLELCPRCRDELRAHREVVGVLAYAGAEAPSGLWDRVAGTIGSSPAAPPLVTPFSRRRPSRLLGALAAAAALVVVGLLGTEVVHLEDRTNHLSRTVAAMTGQPTMGQVRQALSEPGARTVALSSPTGSGPVVRAVILPDGEGYLYGSTLSPLSPAQTYQLWGISGVERISYGVLGPSPGGVLTFRASAGVQGLAVTAEVAGGVVVSTNPPVVQGRLS
jgi:hypothetical protein